MYFAFGPVNVYIYERNEESTLLVYTFTSKFSATYNKTKDHFFSVVVCVFFENFFEIFFFFCEGHRTHSRVNNLVTLQPFWVVFFFLLSKSSKSNNFAKSSEPRFSPRWMVNDFSFSFWNFFMFFNEHLLSFRAFFFSFFFFKREIPLIRSLYCDFSFNRKQIYKFIIFMVYEII